jgi:hypothetical protein
LPKILTFFAVLERARSTPARPSENTLEGWVIIGTEQHRRKRLRNTQRMAEPYGRSPIPEWCSESTAGGLRELGHRAFPATWFWFTGENAQKTKPCSDPPLWNRLQPLESWSLLDELLRQGCPSRRDAELLFLVSSRKVYYSVPTATVQLLNPAFVIDATPIKVTVVPSDNVRTVLPPRCC